MAKPALGKGFDALINQNLSRESLAAPQAGDVVHQLSHAAIIPSSLQPRAIFTPEQLAELVDSIKEHGIIQPLIVRETQNGKYELIAGERRWRASGILGLSTVPAIIREASDKDVLELALIENLQREDLNPMEEAAGYRSLIEDYGLTQEEAAQRVGKSRSAVTNALRLLGLSPSVRKLVEENNLTAGHARALVPLSPSLQESAANAIIAGGLSVRQTEALVKRLSAEKKESKKPRSDEVDYLAEAQNELKAKLCRGVKIVSGRKKGRIELEYYGLDDLNDLLDALALIKINKAKEGPQA